MKGAFPVVMLVLFSKMLSGQELTLSAKFSLSDQQTANTIEEAKIQIIDLTSDKKLWRTLVNGDTLNLPYARGGQWRVLGSAQGYKALDTMISCSFYRHEFNKNNVAEITLHFSFDGQYTGEVDINATYKPEIKFQSERISVSDFVIQDKDHILLLAYSKKLEKGSELIWFVQDKVKSRRKIAHRAEQLQVDFRKNIYLRCESNDYLVIPESSIELNAVDRKSLDDYIFPVLDSLNSNRLYFSNYNPYFPAYDYMMVETEDTSYTNISHIEDDLMMEHYRAEYKFADVRTKLWAWDMEAETGIDRQIWVGANVFTNSIYYDPPIGDFYRIDQTLYVFDFYNNFIHIYNGYTAEHIDSIAIDFHLKARRTGWGKKIIQDPVTKKMYTYFNDAGYYKLAEVNPKTGGLFNKFKLHYRYVENIKVYDGAVYYIYRPFESPQKKFLYVEPLK